MPDGGKCRSDVASVIAAAALFSMECSEEELVGRSATRKAGAEPLATPAREIGLEAFELRFWSVLLEAMCSKEMVPGSERRTSNECVSVKDCFWRVREALVFSGAGGGADGSSTRCMETGGGWINDDDDDDVGAGCDDGPGRAPRWVECV
jgi:hypothetical protein